MPQHVAFYPASRALTLPALVAAGHRKLVGKLAGVVGPAGLLDSGAVDDDRAVNCKLDGEGGHRAGWTAARLKGVFVGSGRVTYLRSDPGQTRGKWQQLNSEPAP